MTEPEHPYVAAWWPAGHMLGYEHGFVHQVVDLVTAISDGSTPHPTFEEGLAVQRVLAAVETSAANGSAWATCRGSEGQATWAMRSSVGRPAENHRGNVASKSCSIASCAPPRSGSRSSPCALVITRSRVASGRDSP